MLDLLFGIWPQVLAGLGALVGVAVAYFKVRKSGVDAERRKATEKDYERANEIRDRVEFDLADRVREYDGRGYRDRE